MNKQSSVIHWFTQSAGVIFFVTGLSEIWSALGQAEVLHRIDPILHLKFSYLMFIAGVTEISVAIICLVGKVQSFARVAVAWLATSLFTYRIGLWWIGWHRPCNCLGNLTDAIHISPQLADDLMKCLLTYLLMGSYIALLWLWRQRNKTVPVPTQN